MSKLYSLRRQIREVLTGSGDWTEGEVLIKRRTDIWNDIAVATGASKHGQCLVIGVAKGRNTARDRGNSKRVHMEVTVPITLVELPTVSPDQPESGEADEDDRWEAMCLLLQGEALGRSALHYELEFDGFEDVEDESYVIRQTVFKTRLLLKPGA
jgi:hypothetical protein